MVRKLMVDDIRMIWRNWRAIMLPALLVAVVSALVFILDIDVISTYFQLMYFIAIIVIITSLPILLIVNYSRSLYSEQGYLAFTLPTKGRSIFASKALTALLFLIIDVAVALALTMAWNSITDLQMRQPLFTTNRSMLEAFINSEHVWTMIGIAAGSLTLAALTGISQFSFIITKSNEARFHSLGKGAPVLMYVITYLLQQAASLIGMLLLPFGVSFLSDPVTEVASVEGWVFESSLPSFKRLLTGGDPNQFTLGLGFIVTLVLLSIVYIVLTIRSMERHTSLK